MKDVLVREVERLLYRPNISPKGKHQHKWRHWRNYLELFLLASIAKIFTRSQDPLNNGELFIFLVLLFACCTEIDL
jgi:hypothetical protein